MTAAGAHLQVELIRLVHACIDLPREDRAEIVEMLAGVTAGMAADLWDEERERP